MPELGGDRRGDVRGLDEVLEDVLPVRGPELQAPEQPDHLRVHVGDPDVEHRLLARALDLLVDLLLRALERLLDPRRVDPPVLHELLEREPGDLAPNGVEAREHHGLGRVVDDQVHPGRGLERADVPALAADDAALHVLARQREHRDRRLARLLGGDPLDRDRHDLAGALLALLAGALLDLAHRGHRLALGLVDDLRAERLLGLGRREPRDLLERGPVLRRRVLELLADQRELAVAIVQLLGPPVGLVDLAVDGSLLLRQAFLLALDLVAPGPDVLLGLAPERADLVLRLDQGLARQAFGLALGLQDHLLGSALGALGLRPGHRLADDEADRDAERQGDHPNDHRYHRFTASFRRHGTANRGPSGTVRPCDRRMRTRAMPGPTAPLALRSGVLPVTSGFSRFQARLNVDQRMNLVRTEPTACAHREARVARSGRRLRGPQPCRPSRPRAALAASRHVPRVVAAPGQERRRGAGTPPRAAGW